ncbi:MAG: cytochrome d ubiquinol oxidase subunit II [Anaerolineales bacterium]|nr:cytochrome d ubiquinol oxidase subunit II [Anaerolineales bacterium]MCS7246930.1 cytochrome d ubiquinol oxidase subunit II [Anaerolineales bacterium]MDW8160741.1 cytochrome d ubiquinol oxidase subunit II [Anaerolineales bacterium]MDW8447490.1 cytochrome d ubiquinol oxidase subunit II [Anaerolineales bacterium]
MDLNTLWFILIAVLYIGFFVLEGFDFGVGMLLPFLSRHADAEKQDRLRRTIINTIGPHWDANEVWLLTAGGATFAAFPHWYATLFSGFYLALFLLLAALIVRGVAFEFRSKDENPKWRKLWDGCIFVGSAIPALLLGVAFANLVRGVPIDSKMHYVGTFFDLLNPYSIVAGLATLLTFALYGAIFLALKTKGEVMERAKEAARRLWMPTFGVTLLLLIMTYFYTDILARLGVNPGFIPIGGAVAFLLSYYFIRRGHMGWAFILVAIAIAFALLSEFMILFPRVMVSSLNPEWSLTIYNASSSPYTLRVMTIVAVIFVPIVLAYQGWSYWVFRKRISGAPEELTY